jgi:hypothetical protein
VGLDLDGNYLWSKGFGGLGWEDRGRVVAKDNWLWLAGSFADTVDFAADFPASAPDVKMSLGYGDVFLSKLSLDQVSTTILDEVQELGRLDVFPNPFLDHFQLRWVSEAPNKGSSMEVWDARGQLLLREKVEDSELSSTKTIDMQEFPGDLSERESDCCPSYTHESMEWQFSSDSTQSISYSYLPWVYLVYFQMSDDLRLECLPSSSASDPFQSYSIAGVLIEDAKKIGCNNEEACYYVDESGNLLGFTIDSIDWVAY